MPAAQRIALIGVAVLSVIAIAVVVVTLQDSGSSPSASASAAPSEASSEPRPSGSVEASDELLAELAEIEAQVIEIRGLPAAEIGPPDLITRAELADELQRIFDEEYPPEDRERDTIALTALGLLEEGQDIGELQLQLLGDSVLGFYDDVDRRMVIVTDAGLDPAARMTYAHEYAHALQDAAFDFDSLETDAPGEDDRGLARTALIEGDASVVMLVWAFSNLSPEELLEAGTGTPLPDTSGIPSWMVTQLEFPYTTGLDWASNVVGNPLAPNFGAIDEAFGSPPDSTEQIIDFAKWETREAPVAIEEIDLAGALGDGWTEVDATPLGQAMIEIMLDYHGAQGAAVAASGWGGDRAVVASGPDDAFALAWRLAWDTPADAAEFGAAYRSIVDTLGFPASVTELANGELLVVHASSEDLLRRTQDAADG
ncbi:MAG TPA: hypothetical protein VI277_07565 [Candidatus Limnocylindria bacterium]